MKNIKSIATSFVVSLCTIGALAATTSAHATADYNATISIVTTNIHYPEFSATKVPYIGCAGIPVYCTISMFTFDYKVPMGGCGHPFTQDFSYNALSCAKFDPTVENVEMGKGDDKWQSEEVTKATIDLSGCEDSLGSVLADSATAANLKQAIKKAFDRNFPYAKALHIKYKGKAL